MRKKLLNTKVTVKLRKSEYKEEWYLIVEAYPVYDPCNPKRKRVVESINQIFLQLVGDLRRALLLSAFQPQDEHAVYPARQKV